MFYVLRKNILFLNKIWNDGLKKSFVEKIVIFIGENLF